LVQSLAKMYVLGTKLSTCGGQDMTDRGASLLDWPQSVQPEQFQSWIAIGTDLYLYVVLTRAREGSV
jgi:hypothetical protein